MFVVSVCVVPTVHGNSRPVNQSCWTKQLSHVHDAWRCDQFSSMWRRVVLSHCLTFSCIYFFNVHTSSVTVHLSSLSSVSSDLVLSCLPVHYAAIEKVHKSLQRRIVYSFYKVCNGCVPLAHVKSLNQINNKPLLVFEICLYTTYI